MHVEEQDEAKRFENCDAWGPHALSFYSHDGLD